MRFSKIFFVCLALLMGFMQSKPSYGLDPQAVAGEVSRIQGKALAVQDAEIRPLSVGEQIYIGDVISTAKDSRLEIKMADEGIFTLGEKTSFVVVDYTFGGRGATINLLQGALDGISGTMAKASIDGLNIQTPLATVGIRGTKFFVGEFDQALQIAHWSGGGVEVTSKAGKVFLKGENEGTRVDPNTDALDPPAPWSAEQKAKAKSLISFSQ